MKEGWVTKKLGEVCGLSPPKSEVRKQLPANAEVSFAPMEQLGIDQKYLFANGSRLLSDVIKSYTYFANGDVLLAKITPCFENGKLSIAKDLLNGVGFGSSEYFVIRPNEHTVSDYIYYFLSQTDFRKRGAEHMTGAVGHKRLPSEFLLEQKLLVPKVHEQQRIVAILDAAFADLAQAKANAEKNLANAKELFASELNTIFMRKGEGWEDKKLYEVAEYFGRGKSKHRPRNDPKLYDGQYPFIQTGDVRNSRHIITTYSQTYNDVGLAQSKLWPKGTVCITIAANIAETGVLDFDACFPDSVIGFIPHKNKSNSYFVGYLMEFFKLKVQGESKGSAQQNINLATFENMSFPFPLLPEQQRIAARLDELSEHCKKLEAVYTQKLALYDEMKQSLLHKAFSGEL